MSAWKSGFDPATAAELEQAVKTVVEKTKAKNLNQFNVGLNGHFHNTIYWNDGEEFPVSPEDAERICIAMEHLNLIEKDVVTQGHRHIIYLNMKRIKEW